jgi:uncharacterized protein (TIGR03437 family)
LLSIFGTNLGPATGVAAPDGTDTSIAGVSITFNGTPAQLLYVSASQINVAVPAPPLASTLDVAGLPSPMVMQLTVNGVTIQRQFPYTISNMNLFADLSPAQLSCPAALVVGNPIQPVAMNADGSASSCANPAKFGSTVSFFMHGVGGDSLGFQPPQQLLNVQAFAGYCPVTVTNASLIDNFVYKVDVTMPASILPCAPDDSNFAVNFFYVTFSYDGLAVGPLYVPFMNVGPTMNFAMPMTVWVTN